MDYLATLLTLTGVLALSVISPGPNFALVSSVAVTESRGAAVLTGLGLAAATFTWALLAVAGLGLIVSSSGWVYTAIQVTGALYLIWLGVKMIRDARTREAQRALAPRTSGWAAARKAYLVSMTNPKSFAFYASIFVIMVPAHAPAWFYAAVVAIAAGVSLTWYCSVALLLSHGAVRAAFARARALFEITIGCFLIVLGGRLLFSR